MKNTVIFGLLLFMANSIYAQSGTLDVTFGENGKVYTPTTTQTILFSSIIQNDGKIIVVGATDGNYEDSSFLISRYMPDGSNDNSFGINGSTEVLVGHHCSAEDIAIQDDGKIVIGGSTFAPQGNNLGSDIMVIRLNENGSLDQSFNNSGMNVINLDHSQSMSSLIIQENGKIVLGGLFSIMSNPNMDTFGLVRFDQDGDLDTSFGQNGLVYTSGFSRGGINDLKNTEEGDIIAVGRIFISGLFAMVKYNVDGEVINSFGPNGDGIVKGTYGEISDFNKCAIFNGEIYIAGAVYDGFKYNSLITKYDIDGNINAMFGDDGILLNDYGADIISFANDVKIDNNSNLIIGSSVGLTTNRDWVLHSYNLNGNLNISFGNNGYFTTSFTSGHDYFRSINIQEDNKIIMVGMSEQGSTINPSLARVLNDENLSVIDMESANQFSVSPNPFENDVQISLSLRESQNISATLYDVTGKLLGSVLEESTFQQGNSTVNLDLSSFALGRAVYFIKVNGENGVSKTLKIVKN